MYIEHAALYVRDIAAARDFFVTYLNASPGAPYHNPSTGFRSCFLRFCGGARLELMTRPVLADGSPLPQIGFDHVAFSLGSRSAVDELTDRLRRDGYAILSGPRVTGDGYYESCIAATEGLRIELTE